MSSDATPGDFPPPIPDETVSEALSAWLAALELVPPSVPFSQASAHCISLCKLFSQFAPTHLSSRDYFVSLNSPGTSATRQARRNIRRLARSLADWLQVQERPISHYADYPTSAGHDVPPIILMPDAKKALLRLANTFTDEKREYSDDITTIGKILLCAAVYSKRRDAYIKAILRLPDCHQDALAICIRHTSMEDCQGINVDPDSSKQVFDPTMTTDSTTNSKDPQDSDLGCTAVVPHADYDSFSSEIEALRAKVTATEKESNFYKNEAEALRNRLESARVEIKRLEMTVHQNEADLKPDEKLLRDAKEESTHISISAEEFDVLKAKAEAAAQLEESLQKISEKVKDINVVRKQTKDLESQLEAYRKNQKKVLNYAETLESNLKTRNDSTQNLVHVSASISSALEKKEAQISFLRDEIKTLKLKLEEKNRRIASIIKKSESVPNAIGTSRNALPLLDKVLKFPRSSNESATNLNDFQQNTQGRTISEPVTVGAANYEHQKIIEAAACNQIYTRLGIQISWNNVIESVRITMAASRDTDGQRFRKKCNNISLMSGKTNGALRSGECVDDTSENSALRSREGSAVDPRSDKKREEDVAPNAGGSSKNWLTSQFDEEISSEDGQIRCTHRNLAKNKIEMQTPNNLLSISNSWPALDNKSRSIVSPTLGVTIQQLLDETKELCAAHALVATKEAERNGLQRELDDLSRKRHSLALEKKMVEERVLAVLEEKNHAIDVLQKLLNSKKKQIYDAKSNIAGMQEDIGALYELEIATKEKIHEAQVKAKAHEIEAARLNAKLKASGKMNDRPYEAMTKSNSVLAKASREGESYMQNMETEGSRDKKLPAEGRHRVATQLTMRNESDLNGVGSIAAAAAAAAAHIEDKGKGTKSRKRTKFSDFCRRVLNRKKTPPSHSETTLQVDILTMEEFEETIPGDSQT